MGKLKTCILEAVVILLASVVLSAIGNAVHSNGIKIGRKYIYEKVERPPPTTTTQTDPGSDAPGPKDPAPAGTSKDDPVPIHPDPPVEVDPDPAPTIAASPDSYVESDWFKNLNPEDSKKLGNTELEYIHFFKTPSFTFNELTSPQAMAWFEGVDKHGIVFVDARTHDHWVDERIPGAISLPQFNFDSYWDAAQAPISNSNAIVIYCAGGDCDNSENLGKSLMSDIGLGMERIYVYRGGMKDWKQNGRPTEKGE